VHGHGALQRAFAVSFLLSTEDFGEDGECLGEGVVGAEEGVAELVHGAEVAAFGGCEVAGAGVDVDGAWGAFGGVCGGDGIVVFFIVEVGNLGHVIGVTAFIEWYWHSAHVVVIVIIVVVAWKESHDGCWRIDFVVETGSCPQVRQDGRSSRTSRVN